MKRTPLDRKTPMVRLSRPRVGIQAAKPPANPKARRNPKRRSGGVPENPAFLKFIRTLPCILHGDPRHVCSGRIEAAHIGWGRGRGQKAPDETAVPMCSSLHRTGEFAQHKTPKTFWQYWKLDRAALMAKYQAAFAGQDCS